MTPPGRSAPRSSASLIIASAARSFTEPPGLRNSALPRIVQPVSSEARRNLISGVSPTVPTKPSRGLMLPYQRIAWRRIAGRSGKWARRAKTLSRDAFHRRGERLSQFVAAEAMAEIAETFLGKACLGEQSKQRVESVGDAGNIEPFGDQAVEAGAFEIAGDIERVQPRHAADDADIAAVRPGATVR